MDGARRLTSAQVTEGRWYCIGRAIVRGYLPSISALGRLGVVYTWCRSFAHPGAFLAQGPKPTFCVLLALFCELLGVSPYMGRRRLAQDLEPDTLWESINSMRRRRFVSGGGPGFTRRMHCRSCTPS